MGRTAIDIIRDVAQRLGWVIPSTVEGPLDADAQKLLNLLRQVLRQLAGANDWNFLRRDGEIALVAPYTTGVAYTAQGSTVIAGLTDGTSAPVWTQDMVGRAIQVGGTNEIYRIMQVPSAITLIINRPYIGVSSYDPVTLATTTFAYTIAQDRYELPTDFDRPIGDWNNFIIAPTIRPVDPNEFLRRRRLRSNLMLLDEPKLFTMYEFDDQGQHRMVALDPFPRAVRLITFQYQGIHPEITHDNDKLRFPLRYDSLIMEAMLYLGRRDYEDDQRMTMNLQDFLREKNESLVHEERTQQPMRITPSTSRRTSENAKWSRGAVGGLRINWGQRFDEIDRYNLGSW